MNQTVMTPEPNHSRHGGRRRNSFMPALSLALVVAGLLPVLPPANAQTNVTSSDRSFMLAAAQGGMTEVKLGELAANGAMRDDVKQFGGKMVKDHSAINEGLKALAAQKGVSLPTSLDAKHQAMVDKMTALTGADFDKAYIPAMVKAHKMDGKAFKAESASTPDADIRSFVDKSIPVIEEHLKMILAIKQQPAALP